MNKYLAFFLCIGVKLTTFEAFSQDSNNRQVISEIQYPIIIEGVVKDSITKSRISYAQVMVLKKRKIKKDKECDSLGNFKLVLNSKDIKGIPFNIKITCLCYVPKILLIAEAKELSTYQEIYLAPIKDCILK